MGSLIAALRAVWTRASIDGGQSRGDPPPRSIREPRRGASPNAGSDIGRTRGERRLATSRGRGRPAVVYKRRALPSSVRYGPLGSVGTIYELPNGGRCVVTFANRGSDVLTPIRNDRGELWIGHLLRDDVEPAHFDDWEREWVPSELLRPVGELN